MEKIKQSVIDVHGNNQLKIAAYNELQNILPQIEKFVGKRIETQTGKSAKFQINFLGKDLNKISPIKENDFATAHNYYLSVEYGQLYLEMKICLHGGSYDDKTHYCQYFNQNYWIGRVDKTSGVLLELDSLEKVVSDYGLDTFINLEEEEKKINEYRELAKQLRELKYSIKIPFNEY